MEKQKDRKYFLNKSVKDIGSTVRRRSIICPIEGPGRENRKNKAKAIFQETMANEGYQSTYL